MATINSELVATVQKSVDGKAYKVVGLQHVPYASSAEVLSLISSTRRHRGQCFYVLNASVIEIWQFVAGFADGDLVKVFPQSGSSVTADNGLTLATGNIKLGGPLTADTTVTSGTFALLIDGTNAGGNPTLVAIATTGGAFLGASTSGTGVEANSGSGIGLHVQSTTGTAFVASITPASATDVQIIANFVRNTSGSAANGIGQSIDFNTYTTVNAKLSNQIISKWTDATDATRTSEFSITGVDSAATGILLQISGAGIFTLPKGLQDFPDDISAAVGGIPINGLYRTGSVVKMVQSA